MKKLFVFVLVLALSAIVITPAFAAGPDGNGGQGGNGNGGGNGGGNVTGNGTGTGTGTGTRSGKGGKMPNVLNGTITSIDPVNRTVTVNVLSANIAAKDYVGQTITFVTTTSTSFVLRNSDGTTSPITFEALTVGLNVGVAGVLSDTGWTATRVTVNPELLCVP
jgi:hypothetical protein